MRQLTRSTRINIAFLVALILCLGIVVLQGKYIRTLQLDEEQLASAGTVDRGMLAPELNVLDSSGKRVVLSYASTNRPTLIYVFRPGCAWCERNGEAVNWLTSQVSQRYRVISLSLEEEGLPEFLKAHAVRFPVYHRPSNSVISALRLHITPETIVISPSGTVLASWKGAYIGSTQSEVERFLAISFPKNIADAIGS